MKKKLIVFDLDGVLINSLSNMRYSWNKVKKKCSVKNNFLDYQKFIGLEFYEILEKLNIEKKKFSKIKKTYSKFSLKSFDKIKLYPEVNKILKDLEKDFKLAILTSKDKKRTHKILKKLLPKIKFSSVQSPQNRYRPKPNSDLLLKVISENNVSLNEAIFIGDSEFDEKMAKNSKVKFIFASYGYSNFQRFNKNKIKNFRGLLKFIN